MSNDLNFIKDNTQIQFAYLIAANAKRPKEPSRIRSMQFVKVLYLDDLHKLCYIVEYNDGTIEHVPVQHDLQQIINQEQVNYYCSDCRKNTNSSPMYDNYMVNDELWKKYGEGKRTLCITCLQCRMDRELEASDFKTDYPMNSSNKFIRNLKNRAK